MPGSGVLNITVKADLAQDGVSGRVHMRVAIERTLDSVIDEFCSHKRIRRQPTFALRNDLHSELRLDLTAVATGLSDGDIVYVFNTDPPPPPPEPVMVRDSVSNWWILSAAALAIGLFGTVSVAVMYVLANQPINAYAIVIDAGSSSSKVYVYTWPASKLNGNGVVSQRAVANSSSAPIENPQGVDQIEASLRSLSWAVPEDRRQKSELFLGATAGMRLYERINATAAAAVMSGARDRLTHEFLYQVSNATAQIRTITGAEEGISAWVTVNYLKDSFGHFTPTVGGKRRLASSQETYGSLDLGGASTQIAFIPSGNYTPSDDSKRHIVPLSLYGKQYSVYAYSFLCYGKAQAQNRMLATIIANAGYNTSLEILSPCWQAGYSEVVPAQRVFRRPCSDDWSLPVFPVDLGASNFSVRGTGDFTACSSIVRAFFNGTCDKTACSFNDVFQPAPSGRFLAFSGFYYVADFFNATRLGAGWQQFNGAVRAFCQQRFAANNEALASPFLSWYCFDGVYVLSLLSAYGFNATNWNLLQFADSIIVNHSTAQGELASSANKVGWSLGYAIQQSGLIPSEAPLVSLSLALFIILLLLFAAFLGFAVVFACLARRVKRARGYVSI